jgi:pyrroline-5-carboxylate reductase
MEKVCIIGMGNMGSAVAAVLADDFEVIECRRNDDVNECVGTADAVVVAVKPQGFAEMAAEIEVDLSEKVVISIMAGIDLAGLASVLKSEKVVRSLPNLPLKIGRSVTPWAAAAGLAEDDKELARRILAKFGREYEVSEEDIGVIGMVSGCGPAYFAYLSEKLADFLVARGIEEEVAREVALETFLGSAEVIKEMGVGAAELRAKITSKRGITAAAINHLEKEGFAGMIDSALERGLERSAELSRGE